jgi:hypothetical protein
MKAFLEPWFMVSMIVVSLSLLGNTYSLVLPVEAAKIIRRDRTSHLRTTARKVKSKKKRSQKGKGKSAKSSYYDNSNM